MNIKYNGNTYGFPVWPTDFCIISNNIWMIHGKLNALFRYDLSNRDLHYVGSVPGVVASTPDLFSNIIFADEKLFLIPLYGERVGVYDFKTKKLWSISLPNQCLEIETRFAGGVLYQGRIHCFPFSNQGIVVVIDPVTLEISTDSSYLGDAPNKYTTSMKPIYIRNDEVLIPLVGQSCGLIYNLQKKTYRTLLINYKNSPISQSCSCVNDEIFFLPYKSNEIVVLDRETLREKGKITTRVANAWLTSFKNRYLLIDSFDKKGAEIYDTKTGKFTDFKYSLDGNRMPESYDWVVGLLRENSEGECFYYNRICNEIICMENGTLFQPILTEYETRKLIKGVKECPRPLIIGEGVIYGLKEFVGGLSKYS